MESTVDIELGKLPNPDQQEPSETTRLNPDGSERYLNIIQSLSRITGKIAKLKGFETF